VIPVTDAVAWFQYDTSNSAAVPSQQPLTPSPPPTTPGKKTRGELGACMLNLILTK